MTVTPSGPQPQLCPLCGKANQCVMASPAAAGAGAQDAPCWCTHTVFSPAQLAAVPFEAQGQACLCPQCAQGSSLPSTS